MIEGLSNDAESSNVAFGFIRERFRVYNDKYGEARLAELRDADVSDVFWKLKDGLKAERKPYSFHELQKKDAEASRAITTGMPTEKAQLDYRRGREDEGIPTHFEAFLLSKLSLSEWKEICESEIDIGYKDTESGGLSVRSVIEHVLADQPRTRAFIDAVQQGVRRFRGSASVYDVGCGAFPVLAIAAALECPECKITCIEINPLSANIARKLVAKLGLQNQIEIHQGDAMEFIVPEDEKIDLLISETIGAGFLDEQMTSIMPQFGKHLSDKGTSIPARANIAAAVTPIDRGVRVAGGVSTGYYDAYILNTNSAFLPRLDRKEWRTITEEETVDVTKAIEPRDVRLPIPNNISSISDLCDKYTVSLSLELILDKGGRRTLTRYQSDPTSPIVYGFIIAPTELMTEKPENCEIRFRYFPGSDSRNMRRSVVVARKDSPFEVPPK